MKDKCEICGNNLEYVTQTDMTKELACYFCGKTDIVNIFCPKGHYICSTCHSKGAIDVIEDTCESTNEKDPFKLADKIMKHPKFKMYGPEHHVLTPAVILAILKNNGIKKPYGDSITLIDIKEAIRRSSKIPGGWCGFYGSCGAGMGSGVAISVFTGATPATNKERTLANKMTAKSLLKIADNLEHCCKRSVKLSICETLEFLKDKFGVNLDFSPENCIFSSYNNKCERSDCLFY